MSTLTITQKLTYGSAKSPLTKPFAIPLTFNKFNTKLGTLTGVKLVLSESGSITNTATNAQPTDQSYTNATSQGQVSITGPDGSIITAALLTLPANGSVPANSTATIATDGGTVSSSSSLSSSHFGAYKVSGTGSFKINVVGNGSASGTGNLTFAVGLGVYGYVQVVYTYTTP